MATLTLNELIAQRKKVYVKNATKNPGGQICLSIIDPSSGRRYPLNIPRTWIPICLSDRLSDAMIIESFDLRQCISNGTLKLIDPDEAEKIMSQSDAQDELSRITTSSHAERQFIKTVKTGKSDNEENGQSVTVIEASDDPDSANPLNASLSPEDSINQRVVDTVLGVENSSIKIADAVSIIRAIEEELTENDFSYIISHVEESQFKTYAKRKLAELSGGQ